MKFAFKNLAFLALICSLAACGGSSSSNAVADPSGSASVTVLKSTDTVVGTGATATAGKSVAVNYSGYLYDGKVADTKGKLFDTTNGRASFTFVLGAGQVISGWDQGVAGMRVGGKRTLTIPASLAYGAAGAAGGLIPANAALVFDIELVAVL